MVRYLNSFISKYDFIIVPWIINKSMGTIYLYKLYEFAAYPFRLTEWNYMEFNYSKKKDLKNLDENISSILVIIML